VAYKYSAGRRDFGDIDYEGDDNTQIDFDVDFVALVTNGAQVLTVSGSKVGIGTSTPDCELHVDGDIKLVGNDPRIKIDGDTNSHPGLELYENGTRKWIVFNDYTNDNLTFKTHDNIRMSIEQDGNVGIGTQSPTQLLDINGDALRIRSSLTPSSASDLGDAGMICWDANYLYVCVAANTWKRIPLDSW